MRFCTNPPWTDKILKTHWAALERRVGAAGMPTKMTEPRGLAELGKEIARVQASVDKGMTDAWWLEDLARKKSNYAILAKQKAKGFNEFGSGHYGTVLPTGTPGMVIKITTDQTEAAFVAAYLSMPKNKRPAGIIPYRKLLAIRGESRMKRPVFVLWRDEAQYVGHNNILRWCAESDERQGGRYYRASYHKVEACIGNCLDAAMAVRKMVVRHPAAKEVLAEASTLMDKAWDLGHPPRPSPGNLALRIGWYLSVFNANATDAENEVMGAYLGRGLRECMGAGLLLADVHLNNIGMPTGELLEEIGMTPIITDPGHAIALDDRYATVAVEEL